ncbi:putative cad88c, partial [Operophtera brumata]
MFQQMLYKRSIPEDLPGGTSVLERGASDKFVIDSRSGVVSVANGSTLDPDKTTPKNTRYTLTVIALDGGIGEQQLSAAVLVNITIVDVNNKPPVIVEPGVISVLDENDNNPVFESSAFEYRVREDVEPGTTVAMIVASDADSG